MDLLARTVAELASRPRLLRLRPAVQSYAWGGYDFIPRLLGQAGEARLPHAEMWLGTHPNGPATVVLADGTVPLAALFERAAPSLLGGELAQRFGGELPYLLKVLDVRSMLSIQAHPDAAQAREGFEREEREGTPRSAPNRSYHDRRHKPEASLALTDFWILLGFRPYDEILAVLDRVPELATLFDARSAQRPAGGSAADDWLRTGYARLMRLPQPEVDRALAPLAGRLADAARRGRLRPSDPEFWAARAAREFQPAGGAIDRGIASIFLLNLLRLRPGEAVFIPAGLLHAYLQGTAVEIMAASDNVLRGGLTPKHVDIDELLRVLRFEGGSPSLLRGEPGAANEATYTTPADEFRLGHIVLDPGARFAPGPVRGADLLLALEGEALMSGGGEAIELASGGAVLAPNGVDYTLTGRRRAVLVRASVPAS